MESWRVRAVWIRTRKQLLVVHHIYFLLCRWIDCNPVSGFTTLFHGLYTIICTIAVWLHLRCGLSRANTNIILQALDIVITAAVKFGLLLSQVSQTCRCLDVDAATIILALPYDVQWYVKGVTKITKCAWALDQSVALWGSESAIRG